MTNPLAICGLIILLASCDILETRDTYLRTPNEKLINNRIKRVIGPNKDEPYSKPWSVFVLTDDTLLCGGFLLDLRSVNMPTSIVLPPENSSDVIVTAAHCVLMKNITAYTAVEPWKAHSYFGVINPFERDASFKTFRPSTNIIVHKDYQKRFDTYYDLALIRLNSSVYSDEYIQQLPISTKAATEVQNCTLSGWGPDQSKPLGIDGNGALVTANISSIYDINGTGHAYGFVKNGARAVPGDSGSPIVCEADDKIFAQGTHSVVYDDNSGLTEYVNLNQLRPWIESSIIELYEGPFFHPHLHRYLRYGMSNEFLPSRELVYLLKNFLGFFPDGINVERSVQEISHRKVWTENQLCDHILVAHDAFNPHDIVNHSSEKDVYHCAAACFINNRHGSCSYVVALGTCIYSDSRQSCQGASCIGYGHNESVHIYFDDFIASEKPQLINLSKQRQRRSPRAPYAVKRGRRSSDCTRLQAYISYDHRLYHVCSATLVSNSGLYFDQALVSNLCVHEIIRPYLANEFDLNNTLHLNVYFHRTLTQRTSVSFIRPMNYGFHKLKALTLELIEPIPFQANGETSFCENNYLHNEPLLVNYNIYMGGNVVKPFTKPWMVLLHNKNEEACHGVFVMEHEQLVETVDIGFILTTAECANMMVVNSVARFGVHLSTMSSLYEQKAMVQSIQIHPKHDNNVNNIALITVEGRIMLSNAVRPISLSEELDSDDNQQFKSNELSAYGWNLKCHHAEILQEIFMIPAEHDLTSSSMINTHPVYGFEEECNIQHHAGRPLMHCDKGNKKCLLLGLSSSINKAADGQMIESFVKVQLFLEWIRNAIKSIV